LQFLKGGGQQGSVGFGPVQNINNLARSNLSVNDFQVADRDPSLSPIIEQDMKMRWWVILGVDS
jgi:hypothetical protein